MRIFDLQIERIDPGYRGCPFQNTGSEIADADHPMNRWFGVEARFFGHLELADLRKSLGT